MIGDSFILMFLGMSVVFAFLVLLMFSVQAMGNVIQKFFPAPVVVPASKKVVATTPTPVSTDGGALVAAISMAVAAFRKDQGK